MTSQLESELTLREECSQLLAVLESWPRLIRNLNASLPGFRNAVTGAAPSSGGPGELDEDGNPVPYQPTERVALNTDGARVDLDRVHKLIDRIHIPVTELYSLAREWGFDPHQAKLDLEDTEHDWCTSCLRIGKCEPRDRSRYALTCRWCGDFKASEGRSPSADLLLAHHEGKRITRAMIEQDHPVGKTRKGRAA